MTDLEEQLQKIESKLDLIINERVLKGHTNLCLDPVTKKFDPSDILNACCCDIFDKKENNNE